MALDVHAKWALFALIFWIMAIGFGALQLVASSRPYEAPRNTTVFAVAAGTWAWTTSDSGCQAATHRISFSPDDKTMTIMSSPPFKNADGQLESLTVYDVLRHSRGSLRGSIRNERRRTAAGRPVVWDLELRGPNRYAWHRTDWLFFEHTAEIRRCGPPYKPTPFDGPVLGPPN